mmetsp:Transcript_565/g.1069  ORF Transcript_565/g.1069 Transcript_565/m.1069 type:complete len:247 (+) Transcript_565:177-917(+)
MISSSTTDSSSSKISSRSSSSSNSSPRSFISFRSSSSRVFSRAFLSSTAASNLPIVSFFSLTRATTCNTSFCNRSKILRLTNSSTFLSGEPEVCFASVPSSSTDICATSCSSFFCFACISFRSFTRFSRFSFTSLVSLIDLSSRWSICSFKESSSLAMAAKDSSCACEICCIMAGSAKAMDPSSAASFFNDMTPLRSLSSINMRDTLTCPCTKEADSNVESARSRSSLSTGCSSFGFNSSMTVSRL